MQTGDTIGNLTGNNETVKLLNLLFTISYVT